MVALNNLPIFVRVEDRAVILLGEGEAAEAKRRLLERAGARIVGEDSEAALAIVAFEDEGEAVAAVARLRARGILVNSVDRAALCDFTLPAIVDRSPVLIAIGTGGFSAGLAKALRQRLELLLPASLGPLARALGEAKPAIRARWPDPATRRRAIDDALSGPLDPFVERAEDAVARWLDTGARPGASAETEIVLRSADSDDLTLREARWLAGADLVLYEPGVPAAVLDRARADAARRPLDAPGAREGMIVTVRAVR